MSIQFLICNSLIGNSFDPMYYSSDESSSRDRKTSMGNVGGTLLSNFMRKITNGITNSTNDRVYRTSPCCFAASVPRREITHWVRTN
jgi:hypothetical protein